MKKLFFLIVSIFFLGTVTEAQISTDSQHDFYTDSLSWYIKGYVPSLPQLKPYPLNIIKTILETVIENAPQEDANRARMYYRNFIEKFWHAGLDVSYNSRLYSIEDTENDKADAFDLSHLISSEVLFSGDYSFSEYLGLGYSIGLRGQNEDTKTEEVLPRNVRNRELEGIPLFNFNAGFLDLLLDTEVSLYAGSKTVYGTVGITRPGYGLFPDSSIILNPAANQYINASFNYEGKYAQYCQTFGLLGASKTSNPDDYTLQKYLFFHSYNLPLANLKFSVSYFESIIAGPHFMPEYFLPVPWVIIANVAGFNENVLAGVKMEYKPVPCFTWNTEFLFDDMQIKKFIKLKWNDAALRTAFKSGIIYTPLESICQMVTLDYTLVTPYTYTRYGIKNEPYYTDYTNFDKCIGSEIVPNSDRVNLAIAFRPIPRLKIKTSTSYSRHGNLNQDLFSISDDYDSLTEEEIAKKDEKVSAIKTDSDKYEELSSQTNFLNQKDIMYIMQASLDFEYDFVQKTKGFASLSFGYTFEYIKKDGVDMPLYSDFYTTQKQVQEEYEAWKANLHNSYNHYFRVGVKIRY